MCEREGVLEVGGGEGVGLPHFFTTLEAFRWDLDTISFINILFLPHYLYAGRFDVFSSRADRSATYATILLRI